MFLRALRLNYNYRTYLGLKVSTCKRYFSFQLVQVHLQLVRMVLTSALSFLSCILLGAQAASIAHRQTRGPLQQVTHFGANPANVSFYIYVPNNLAQKPGIVVAIHYCTGT